MPTLPPARVSRMLGGSLIVLGLLLAAWKWWPRPAAPPKEDEDPRLTFPTPYRNVHPEVRYVGDQECSGCHGKETKEYRQHPMGRSFAPTSEAAPVERYEPAARNPFEKFGFQFLVERRGERVVHKEKRTGQTAAELEAEVHYAVGSGTRGRTYLIDRDGYLFQSPISWYSQEGFWDLTPGLQVQEHFERPARVQCLFCHCNQIEPVPDT